MLVLVPKFFFTQCAEDYLFSLLVQYDQSEMGQTWKSLPEKWGRGVYLLLTVSTGLFCLGPFLDPYHPLSQDSWREWQSYLGKPHRTCCRCACTYKYLWYTNQIFLY